MGQYYRPVLIDDHNTMEALSSHAFDSGSKLTEHSWIGNEFVNAVYILLHNKKKRVGWIGDYANENYDPETEPYARSLSLERFADIYDQVWGSREIPDVPKGTFNSKALKSILDYGTTGMYLINHTHSVYLPLAEYISLNKYPDEEQSYYWCVNPLPLLTACGNGRGGGDYMEQNPDFEHVGIWAFNTLEYAESVPGNYVPVMYRFKDR